MKKNLNEKLLWKQIYFCPLSLYIFYENNLINEDKMFYSLWYFNISFKKVKKIF